jgi:hypothetical protein
MTRVNGCTMEEFAEATGIPASFLNQIGITEVDQTQGQAVRLSDAVTYLAPPPSDGMGDDQAVERSASSSDLSASSRSTSSPRPARSTSSPRPARSTSSPTRSRR